MKNEILESILDLKEFNDPKLKKVIDRLEHSVNEELLDSLKCITLISKRLGYGTVQKLLKDVSEIVDDLERGKPDWK